MFWERQSPPAHSGWGPLLVELERSNKTVLWDRLVLLPFFPFQIHLNIEQIIPKELEREFGVLYKRTIWMFHDMELQKVYLQIRAINVTKTKSSLSFHYSTSTQKHWRHKFFRIFSFFGEICEGDLQDHWDRAGLSRYQNFVEHYVTPNRLCWQLSKFLLWIFGYHQWYTAGTKNKTSITLRQT